jgi:hypothetical protein
VLEEEAFVRELQNNVICQEENTSRKMPVFLEDCNVIIPRKLSAFDFQNPYGFTNISFN